MTSVSSPARSMVSAAATWPDGSRNNHSHAPSTRSESVNLYEAPVAGFYWVAASVCWGGLIQAVAGIAGGWGGLLVKRSGWAV
jgi:hypothetical protein